MRRPIMPRLRLRSFLAAAGGNVAILFSLSSPIMIAGVSFGVETGYWFYRQASLQSAADAAAYAAALEARAGSTNTVITSAATTAAAANGFSTTNGTIQITNPYGGGGGGSTSVKVLLTRTEKRYFSQVFTTTPVQTSAKAIATFSTSANACIVALDKSASGAVSFSGNSTLTLTSCNVMANSISASSVTAQGSATVSVPCIMTAGGVSLTANVTQTSCTSSLTQLPQVADPFKDVPPPTASGNCKNGNGNTLQPGNYCNGMNLSGNVNLNAGTYYVSGDIKINANANISGSGVTIFLAGSSSITINGNATVNLSAPTTGTYSGILFYGDPSNTSSVSNKFNGTAGSKLTGALYFPTQDVSYLGNFSGTSGCMQIVAKTVQWTGNTTMSVNCSSYGMKNLPVSSVVKLTG
jgi:Flp pilus assembly protein TadG